ncbi:MAG: hypothetical protein ACOY93_02015 [Bacillota bacterium]
MFVSVISALIVLGFLSWRDLNERTRRRRAEDLNPDAALFQPEADSQEELPQPPGDVTPAQVVGQRRFYVNTFWAGIFGNLLLLLVGLLVPAVAALYSVGTVMLLLLFSYASFRILRLLGHDPLTSLLLCLLILVPFFAVIQYAALSRRCRVLFGPLEAAPGP